MAPKARPLNNQLPHTAISVDALFAAAFHKSHRIYQRESLLGWRPVLKDTPLPELPEKSTGYKKKSPSFSNSPDVKIKETSDIISIEIELPDIDEESLYLEVSGNLLMIRAKKIPPKRPGPKPAKAHKSVLVHRYVQLPFSAKPGHIQARLEGSVLRIKIGNPLASVPNTDLIER